MPHPLADLVRAALPMLDHEGRPSVVLADDDPDDPDDGALRLALRVFIRDEDGEDRGMSEQTVELVPPEHRDHPHLAAYLRASAAAAPEILREEMLAFPAPSDLFFPELLADPDLRDERSFRAALTDPLRRAGWLADREDRDRRAAFARAVGPGRVDALLALMRPRYTFEAVRCDDFDEDDEPGDDTADSDVYPATSRVGGHPGLPREFPWPHLDGQPLAFIAQIDLAELPRLPPGPDQDLLPRRGVLSLFLGLTGGEDPARGPGRLFYFSDPDALVRRPPPTGDRDLVLCEYELIPELQPPALPGWEQPFHALLLDTFGAGDQDPYSRACEPLRAVLLCEGTDWIEGQPRHQLLGYPAVLQSDPLAAAAHDERAHLGVPHPPWPSREHAEQAAQWRLLLQIDSDDDFLLGDMGMVHVVIRDEDLRAGRFDRARIVWQMH